MFLPLFVSAPDDPKTIQATALLQCDPNTFFGAIARLWCWAVPVASEDGLLRSLSGPALALVARWSGNPTDFWHALELAGWAKEVPEGVLLSGWAKGGGAVQRKLRLDRERHLNDDDTSCTGHSSPPPPQGGAPKVLPTEHSAEVPRKFHGKLHTRRDDQTTTTTPLTPRKRGGRGRRPRRADPGAQSPPGQCNRCEQPIALELTFCQPCFLELGGTAEDAQRIYGGGQS